VALLDPPRHREGGAEVKRPKTLHEQVEDTLHGKPWEDLDTHPPGDWAETRAQDWLASQCDSKGMIPNAPCRAPSLAALLREAVNAVLAHAQGVRP
jgi:hypothetical protein